MLLTIQVYPSAAYCSPLCSYHKRPLHPSPPSPDERADAACAEQRLAPNHSIQVVAEVAVVVEHAEDSQDVAVVVGDEFERVAEAEVVSWREKAVVLREVAEGVGNVEDAFLLGH